jgi:predicted amidophosphoribosyltransferase
MELCYNECVMVAVEPYQVCPACGQVLVPNAKFCPDCGLKLSGSAVTIPFHREEAEQNHRNFRIGCIGLLITLVVIFLLSQVLPQVAPPR